MKYLNQRPQDWENMLEEDPNFSEDFKRVFHNDDVLKANYFAPQLLEDTYVDIEKALPRDVRRPKFEKVTKRLRGINGIPIGRAYENLMFNTRVYDVEYLDGNKASLYENNIADNIF